MKKEFFFVLKTLIPLTIILFFSHKFIISNYSNYNEAFYKIESIYIFHLLVTLIICLSLILVKNSFYDKTGFAFMTLSVLKMLASILFLLPLIQQEYGIPMLDIATFFIPYFIFLFYEIIFSISLLKSEKKRHLK